MVQYNIYLETAGTFYASNVEENNDLLLIPGRTQWMVFPLIINLILKHFLYNWAPKAAQMEDKGGKCKINHHSTYLTI